MEAILLVRLHQLINCCYCVLGSANMILGQLPVKEGHFKHKHNVPQTCMYFPARVQKSFQIANSSSATKATTNTSLKHTSLGQLCVRLFGQDQDQLTHRLAGTVRTQCVVTTEETSAKRCIAQAHATAAGDSTAPPY
jgi:hypothetical protein